MKVLFEIQTPQGDFIYIIKNEDGIVFPVGESQTDATPRIAKAIAGFDSQPPSVDSWIYDDNAQDPPGISTMLRRDSNGDLVDPWE